MSKKFIKISSAFTAGALTVGLLTAPAFAATPDTNDNLNAAISYLASQQESDGCIPGFGGETAWTVTGVAAAGEDPSEIKSVSNSLVDCLVNNQPDSSATATTWEREILAVVAAGENPYDFGGANYVTSLQSFATGGQLGSDTLLNDDFFGVLALISAGDGADQTVISNSIDFIISHQQADGSFSWSTNFGGDTNDTAFALQALKAARDNGFSNTGLSNSISSAENYLTSSQNPDGGWGYMPADPSDPSSTAAVIPSLIGMDGAVTEGLNFLVGGQNSDGSFSFIAGSPGDTFTTSTALLALAQSSLPTSLFEGDTKEEPPEQPKIEPEDPEEQEQSEGPPSDKDGQVLAASDNKDDGEVLAEVLPDTGISANLSSINRNPSNTKISQTNPATGILLGFAAAFVAFGLSLNFLSRWILRNDID